MDALHSGFPLAGGIFVRAASSCRRLTAQAKPARKEHWDRGPDGGPEKVKWDEKAEAELERVPFFVRKMARKKVESYVNERGREVVTPADVEEARKGFLQMTSTGDDEAGRARGSGPGSPSDVALYRVDTCRGSELDCPFSLVKLAPLKDRLIALMEEEDFTRRAMERISGPVLAHHQFRVALSACPNACSQPQVRDVGVVARLRPVLTGEACNRCGLCAEACMEDAVVLADEGPVIDRAACVECGLCALNCPTGTLVSAGAAYRVLVGGKLGRHPQLGLELLSAASEDEVVTAVAMCIGLFLDRSREDRRFGDVVNRLGMEQMTQMVRRP